MRWTVSVHKSASARLRRLFGRRARAKEQEADVAPAAITPLAALPTSDRSHRAPLILLSFFIELPFDTGLSNDQAFNAIDVSHPLEDWSDFDLQAFLGMPPLPEAAVRPCTVFRFRRVTNVVEGPFANVERAFGRDLPFEMPSPEDLPPLDQSRSVVQAIRIAPHDTADFGERWVREQFAIVLSALNSHLIALGAAADDHRIAPIHELQLSPIVLGFQGDLRDLEDGELRDQRAFTLLLHPGRYGESDDHDATVINRALAILGQGIPGPFYPAMELLFAARRSLEEGRLTHAVLEAGTAIELLVSGVVVGIGMDKHWPDEKLENILSDKTPFRSRFVDHFAKAFGISVDSDASGSDPINTWLRVAYPLRNKVAHRGYRPTNEETVEAVSLAAMLIDFTGKTAEENPRFGIKLPSFEELIPAPMLDERSLARESQPSQSRLAREAFVEGLGALRHDDTEAAKRAFAEADRHGGASGAYNLAILQLFDGEEDAAVESLRRAAQRQHSGAAAYLGGMLFARGETDEAESWLRQGTPPGHPTAGPLAAYYLARILDDRDELEEAADLYRQAAAADDSPLAADAAFRRGTILDQRGDAAAVDAYRRASQLDSAKGAVNLANYLAADGRIEEAKAALRHAIEVDDAELRGRAAFNLGLLLELQGRDAEAESTYQQALECGEPQSRLALARLSGERGDQAAARAHLRAAWATDDAEVSAAAAEMAREFGIALN